MGSNPTSSAKKKNSGQNKSGEEMKALLDGDGYLGIYPENKIEAYALKMWWEHDRRDKLLVFKDVIKPPEVNNVEVSNAGETS